MKTILTLILVFLACALRAQDKPEFTPAKIPLTDTLVLKPTMEQFTHIVELIRQSINLSYTAKIQSETATIPVLLWQTLEAIDKIKVERQNAVKQDTIKTKTK